MKTPPSRSPKRRFPATRRRTGRRGAALILTLLVMTMLTLLVIAYFTTMRLEQQAAISYANTQRAKMVAQGAVSHGISILRENIPDPALINEAALTAPGENWAVNPGRLTLFDDKGTVRHIDLHTGTTDIGPDATNDPDVHSADLNEPLPGETYPMIAAARGAGGEPVLTGDPPPMRVKWVPVLEDPSSPPGEDNPISARYAFWIDDESSRINFNTALGKPSREANDPQDFWGQYDLGLMTPLFTQGRGDIEFNQNSNDREWALGKLRSVNLDVLFDSMDDIDTDGLLGHAWLRGFSRYPEAILDFLVMDEDQRREWWHLNKYDVTFYSRAPEFNAFGRSRLFTTNIPLSLEAGPLYQLPFVYNGPGKLETSYRIEGILHLHSLMGSLGFTHGISDGKDEGSVHAANIVNRAQFEMLKRYMARRWPGYENASFIDKYGERECYQMALSMLTMARMATTTMNAGSGGTSSRDWAWRTTSVIYSPHGKERPGATPERHYWQVPLESEGGKEVPMLPDTGPLHITEVRLIAQPVQSQKSPNDPTKKYIRLQYQVEYYMNGMGPVMRLNYFPAKVDYLEIVAKQGVSEVRHVLGPQEPDDSAETDPSRNWNYSPYHSKNRPNEDFSLGNFQTNVGNNLRIGPLGSGFPNRVMVSSPARFLGMQQDRLPNIPKFPDRGYEFDETKGRVTMDVVWRLGMGVRPDNRRPRQMIPLGESRSDCLEARFEIDLRSDEQEIVSWQIKDPRLSWHLSQWIIDTEDGGTPGERNAIKGDDDFEPEEDSTEKSKYRYFSRGPGSVQDPDNPKGRKFGLNRPDEYNSRSRISSKGYWSVLHTGIQNLVPWRTLDLGGSTTTPPGPPDWLLLDLLGATYPMQHDQWRINSTLPDEFSTVSFMNSTAGQINLNSKVYPEGNPYFQAPPRRRPLEAVFKYLRTDAELDRFLDGIEDYQRDDFFRYIGEIALIDGYRRTNPNATQWENEELLRNMAGCLTTKSNTFGLWGAAQVVKKLRDNTEYGEFEDGDLVLGEKRFYAVIERYIWPGKDGMPGNAHVSSSGRWDRIAQQNQSTAGWSGQTTDTLYQLPGSPPMRKGGGNRLSIDYGGVYPAYDGPQEVEMDRYAARSIGRATWSHSTLEDAYNPPQPVIKYRVVYFKYLDE